VRSESQAYAKLIAKLT